MNHYYPNAYECKDCHAFHNDPVKAMNCNHRGQAQGYEEQEVKVNWEKCAVDGCDYKQCLNLGSTLCYIHTLVEYPLIMAKEIVKINEAVFGKNKIISKEDVKLLHKVNKRKKK